MLRIGAPKKLLSLLEECSDDSTKWEAVVYDVTITCCADKKINILSYEHAKEAKRLSYFSIKPGCKGSREAGWFEGKDNSDHLFS